MKLEHLKNQCELAIRYEEVVPLPGAATITLKMPENKNCPKQRRLFGRTGPLGDVVAWGFDGYDTVIFKAQEVLDFIQDAEMAK